MVCGLALKRALKIVFFGMMSFVIVPAWAILIALGMVLSIESGFFLGTMGLLIGGFGATILVIYGNYDIEKRKLENQGRRKN